MQPEHRVQPDTIVPPSPEASQEAEVFQQEALPMFLPDGRGKAWLILLILLSIVFLIARLIGFI